MSYIIWSYRLTYILIYNTLYYRHCLCIKHLQIYRYQIIKNFFVGISSVFRRALSPISVNFNAFIIIYYFYEHHIHSITTTVFSTTKSSSLSVFSVYVFASSKHHPSPVADKLLSSGAKKHFYISQKPELSECVIRGDVGRVYTPTFSLLET